mgnify:CR=1 FL=1
MLAEPSLPKSQHPLAIIANDMQAVDAAIRAQLHSDVPLVSTIADYIISAGGKRIRPALVLLMAERLQRLVGLRVVSAFERLTGCAVLVNTSFNVRGEPIVCTPEDAYRCFMRTDIDVLVLGPFVLEKSAQPKWKETKAWQQEFQLD